MNQDKRIGYKFRNRRYGSGKYSSFLTPVITALAATVLKDLTSGNSKILQLTKNFFTTGKLTSGETKKQILEAEYDVIAEEKSAEEISDK
jgi:hypothetical protein